MHGARCRIVSKSASRIKNEGSAAATPVGGVGSIGALLTFDRPDGGGAARPRAHAPPALPVPAALPADLPTLPSTRETELFHGRVSIVDVAEHVLHGEVLAHVMSNLVFGVLIHVDNSAAPIHETRQPPWPDGHAEGDDARGNNTSQSRRALSDESPKDQPLPQQVGGGGKQPSADNVGSGRISDWWPVPGSDDGKTLEIETSSMHAGRCDCPTRMHQEP